MKSILTILVVLLSLQFAFAQYVVTYSPDNPEVGDVVTFTITNQNSLCTYQIDPDANDANVGLVALPGASHTYTAPGTYLIGLDEQCNLSLRVPVSDALWNLENSSGVNSPDHTITIVAAGATAAVPTMGEWGVIALVILMLICCTVAIKEIASQKYLQRG